MSPVHAVVNQVPNGPPGCVMATSNGVLSVTVLHATAADFFWRQRQVLTEAFSCSGLRLMLLRPENSSAEPIQMEWSRPPEARPLNDPPINRH
jgi:hypothetical protein